MKTLSPSVYDKPHNDEVIRINPPAARVTVTNRNFDPMEPPKAEVHKIPNATFFHDPAIIYDKAHLNNQGFAFKEVPDTVQETRKVGVKMAHLAETNADQILKSINPTGNAEQMVLPITVTNKLENTSLNRIITP